MRLESYDASSKLLDMGLSYDMSLKYYNFVNGTLPMPTTSTNIISDVSVTYNLKISTSVSLTNAWLYDWFIV